MTQQEGTVWPSKGQGTCKDSVVSGALEKRRHASMSGEEWAMW